MSIEQIHAGLLDTTGLLNTTGQLKAA